MSRARISSATAFAIVAGGFVISVALNWPGELSYDSVVQLYEGRSGLYGNWHPPVMSWLLGIFDGVVPGTRLFVLFDAGLVFGALGLALGLSRRVGWAAVAVTLVLVLTPQFLLYPGIVWKDVLFAGAGCVGFLLLAAAARSWSRRGIRLPLLAGAMLLLVLAALARQNGIVVLPLAALALGLVVKRMGSRGSTALVWGAGALFLALLIYGAAWSALQLRVVGQTGPLGQLRLLETYDLAGALHSEPGLPLERLAEDEPELEQLMRKDAAPLYTPERNDTLATSAALQSALLRADEHSIPAQWRETMLANPVLYLRLRRDAFAQLFFTPDPLGCRPVFTGVTGPPPLLKTLGLKERFDARDRGLTAYALAFVGTPVLWHPAFALIALVSLVLLFVRRRPEDIAVGFLVVSALVFTASFFAISIACDYRYLYFLDLAAMLALAYLAANTTGFRATIFRGRTRDNALTEFTA